MCLELVEAANNWSEDFVLLLHSPTTAWIDTPYMDQIRRTARDTKVYLSLKPVVWERLPELISSADIGLVFFKNVDPCAYEIGRSSNKLVQYLQVGLPIITIDFPSLKEVLEECRCGECTHNPNEIETLIRRILADYGTYRDNAFKCYTERYSLSRYFDGVLERIRQLE
jgi:glycosyltransferase involved in cell wall biosynthesis